MKKSLSLTLTLLLALVLVSGCSALGLTTTAEHEASLATIKHAEEHVSAEYLEWAGAIAQQPGAKPLPDLTTFTPEERAAWYRSRAVRKEQLDRVLSPATQPAIDAPVIPSPPSSDVLPPPPG